MRESGEWLVPQLNGRPFFQKPVLPIWFICGGFELFGVGEFGARIVSALFGIATVLVTSELGRMLFGGLAGPRAGLVLCSSLLFAFAARSAMIDSPFVFFFTAAIFFFERWRRGRATGALGWVPIYAAMGLAALWKGPVGILLPIVVVGLESLRSGGLPALRRARPAAGLLLACAVALPGYLLPAIATRGESARAFFFRENLDRFFSPMEGHRGPFWIYAPVLLVAFLPWSTFAPEAVRSLRGQDGLGLLLLWVAVPFLFFSLAATKLPHYLLPVFPALALLIGGASGSPRKRERTATLPLVLALLLLSLVPAVLLAMWERWGLVPVELVVTAALLPAGGLVALLLRRRALACGVALVMTMLVFLWVAAAWALPALDALRVVKPIGEALRPLAVPAYSYRFLEPGLPFYARKRIEVVDSLSRLSGLLRNERDFALIAREEDVAAIRAAVGEPLTPTLGRRGICEDRGILWLVLMRRSESRSSADRADSTRPRQARSVRIRPTAPPARTTQTASSSSS